MVVVLSKSVQARPDVLARLRGAAVAAYVQAGGDASMTADVALAVTEACANAVRHADTGQTGTAGAIQLRAWVEEDLFLVQVCDHGAVPAPGEAWQGGGELGMRLMEQIAEVDVAARESGGTEVRLALPLREVPSVVSAKREDQPGEKVLLRSSALAQRMNAARAEGIRLTELSRRERLGMPLTWFRG